MVGDRTHGARERGSKRVLGTESDSSKKQAKILRGGYGKMEIWAAYRPNFMVTRNSLLHVLSRGVDSKARGRPRSASVVFLTGALSRAPS